MSYGPFWMRQPRLILLFFLGAQVLALFLMVHVELRNSGSQRSGSTMTTTTTHKLRNPAASRIFYPTELRHICYVLGCDEWPHNVRAIDPADATTSARAWNAFAIHSLERYFEAPNDAAAAARLNEAFSAAQEAHRTDPTCRSIAFNLALIHLERDELDSGVELLKTILQHPPADAAFTAKVNIFVGLALERRDPASNAPFDTHYAAAKRLDPMAATTAYAGIVATGRQHAEYQHVNRPTTAQALFHFAFYHEFAPNAIWQFGALPPTIQHAFGSALYVVVRDIMPPYVQKHYEAYALDITTNNAIALGDPQSKRYIAYNDRVSRFVHAHLADLVRHIVRHSVKPSYTYFGGYVPGAELKPHVDRKECEYTMSFTIARSPGANWSLGLNTDPVFDVDGERTGAESEPNAQNTVWVDLQAGDALLFMGRYLSHFRKGALAEGQWLNQVFLHYVMEDFA